MSTKQEQLREFTQKEVETIYDMISIMNPKSKEGFVAVALPNLYINLFHYNRKNRTEELTGIVEWCEGMKKGLFDFDKWHEEEVEYQRGKHNGKEETLFDIQVYIKSLIGENNHE